MRNIKGTLLDMSSDTTKDIIKLIFDNDIEKHSLRDSFSYSNFRYNGQKCCFFWVYSF